MADKTRKGFVFSSDPPPEVSAYLRQKGDQPAFRWSEVWGEEHAHAFTVAKATQADILSTIRESLQWAIDHGVPYDTWARELKPELQRKGWWGQVEMADPATGEVKERELGSPRRLETIYQANLRSARAAGQYERAQRTKAVLPFWLYSLGPSVNHRVEHAAKEGMVRPVDDPIWDAWFPPNGWGCKCHLRQITRAEANRRGVTPAFDVPTKTFRRTRDDGSIERVQVPVGIDPGWQTNPGRSRSQTLMTNITERLASAGEPAARVLMSDFWKGSTPDALKALPNRALAPAAIAPARVMQDAGASTPVVLVGSDYLAKVERDHGLGRRPVSVQDFGRVQAILDQGELVERRGARRSYAATLDDGLWLVVLKTTGRGELAIVTLFPIGPDKLRRLKRRAEGR